VVVSVDEDAGLVVKFGDCSGADVAVAAGLVAGVAGVAGVALDCALDCAPPEYPPAEPEYPAAEPEYPPVEPGINIIIMGCMRDVGIIGDMGVMEGIDGIN
jgi:hypothetical protein